MTFFNARNTVLVALCALAPMLGVSACGGNEFTGGSAKGSGGSSAGSGTTGGTGTGVACDGPEDCDDGDICTTDHCNADGTCGASPRCGGTDKCCNGECAECCGDDDCDDEVSCTTNKCFLSQCMFIPDDSQCGAAQYCSSNGGCRPRQACGLIEGEDTAVVCDDENPCTGDTCVGNFCAHDFCLEGTTSGGLCCPNKGCAKECCSDSQCNRDNDPCTVGSCSEDGTCSEEVALCPRGQQCCPSADGQSATCGACCTSQDCDDRVGCTKDQCGGGQCSYTPDPDPDKRCDDGFVCVVGDPSGCQPAPTCKSAADCLPASCQTDPSCVGGQCQFRGCPAGTKCCGAGCSICCGAAECADLVPCTRDSCGANGCSHTPDDSLCPGQVCDPVQGCVDCDSSDDCDDGIACTKDTCSEKKCTNVSSCAAGKYCDQASGSCVGCLKDSDCTGGVIALITGGGGCSAARCVSGTCTSEPVLCSAKEVCCSPYGCTLPGSCNVLEAQ